MRFRIPKNELWTPGALEFSAVVRIVTTWIVRIRFIFRRSGDK